jgi:Mrp family chromosome partitioning ATPase
VILIDANLRDPAIHKIFQLPNETGLTTLLSDTSLKSFEGFFSRDPDLLEKQAQSLSVGLQTTSIQNLQVLSAGPTPSINATELLSSPHMGALLNTVRKSADIVILDAAPILPVADTIMLSAMGAGVVMVVEAEKTRANDVSAARNTLISTNASLLGVIINRS